MATFKGTAGGDDLVGTSGNDVFLLGQGGSDTVDGGGGNDLFRMGAALDAGDRLDGGTGKDAVTLDGDYSAGLVFNADTITNIEVMGLAGGHSYKLTLNDGNIAAGQRLLVRADALGSTDHLVFNGAAETDGNFTIIAGAGDDTLTGGAKHDVFDLSLGGHDKANGGSGTDTFDMGAALTAGDLINGGAGSDTLVLDGDYSDGLILGAATIQGVETIRFGAGHDYNLTSSDANVAIHKMLTVDASALAAGDTVSYTGTAETNGAFVFMGGQGNNFFSGGAGNDQFDFVASAFNEGTGGGGNDIFSFGGDNANVDQVDGGSGSNALVFNGDYTSLGLTDSAVVNIETIFFEGSHTYSGVAISGDISAGEPVTIRADFMLAGDLLALDASASSNAIDFHGGAGFYTITGSGGSDTFDAGAGFTGFDSIDGGAGNDTLALDGDYTLGFVPGEISGIETITLAGGHDYNLSTSDDNIASGETLTVDGSALGAGDSFSFFGSSETDGSFHIVSHAGSGLLLGGNGDDTFDLGAGAFNLSVQVNGGAGFDTMILDGVYAPGTNVGLLGAEHIEMVKLAAGHSYNLIESGGASLQAIDASSLGTGDHLTFDSTTSLDGITIFSGPESDQLSVSHEATNTFVYSGLPLSGDTRDTITNFDGSGTDVIVFHAVSAVESVSGGTLNNSSFDSDLASDLPAFAFPAGEAVVFTPFSGDLQFDTFLIVDGNGVAGYQAGFDLVIELGFGFGFTSSLTPANFAG